MWKVVVANNSLHSCFHDDVQRFNFFDFLFRLVHRYIAVLIVLYFFVGYRSYAL